MATVELHNRSADVASPGCLAGLSEDSHRNNNLFALSCTFSPLRFLGCLGPSSERCRKFLRHLCMRHRSEDPMTRFPGEPGSQVDFHHSSLQSKLGIRAMSPGVPHPHVVTWFRNSSSITIINYP